MHFKVNGKAIEQRKANIDFSAMVYGKVPPQAKELEDAILGALILEPEAYDRVQHLLYAEGFYVDAHQRIFAAIKDMNVRNQKVDLLTIVHELKARQELDMIGGPYYITKLTNAVASGANIEDHSRIVFQKYIMREIIRICGEAIGLCYEDYTDPFKLLEDAQAAFKSIDDKLASMVVFSLDQLRVEIVHGFQQRFYNHKHGIVDTEAVYTYIPEWDKINGRMAPGVYIIAARPAVGKSVLAIQLLVNIGKVRPVGFINVEMTNKQQLIRIGNNMEGLPNEIWRKQDHEITEADVYWVEKAINSTAQLQLLIEDNKHIDKIAAKIKYWVRNLGVRVVIVDILTKVRLPDGMHKRDRKSELDYILGVFTDLAVELGIPIIVLTHINRDSEKRSGKLDSKEPTMSDLKGSGDIEDFARQVMILHRPEQYGILEDEHGQSTMNLMKMKIVKHNEGDVGTIWKTFRGSTSRIEPRDYHEGWPVRSAPVPQLPVNQPNPDKFFNKNFKTGDFAEGFNNDNEI